MNTKQLRKKSFGWLSVFLRWHLFFIFAFFFLLLVFFFFICFFFFFFFSFFFFFINDRFSFPLFSIVVLGYICFAPFVVRDSKRLFFLFFLVFFFLSFLPSMARPGF